MQQALKYHEGTAEYSTVAIDLAGCLAFGALFFLDRKAADDRVSRREKVLPPVVAPCMLCRHLTARLQCPCPCR